MHLMRAVHDDVPRLAEMNWQLIRDEGSDNAMTLEQLTVRMSEFLRASYDAWWMVENQHTVGYILVDMGKNPVYIRHFFVSAPFRRRGYGRAAFALLLVELRHVPLDVAVLNTNIPAVAFWQSVGFATRVYEMRRR